jgi:hypothetical protein
VRKQLENALGPKRSSRLASCRGFLYRGIRRFRRLAALRCLLSICVLLLLLFWLFFVRVGFGVSLLRLLRLATFLRSGLLSLSTISLEK